MSFAKDQPKDGDTIMHCGHCDDDRDRRAHWFKYEAPIAFVRLDGSRGKAEWFAACEPCFIRHGAKVMKYVRGDARWSGDEPAIEKVES